MADRIDFTVGWVCRAVCAAIVLCCMGAYPGLAGPLPARKSIAELTGPELMSLRRGVATMMARNAAPRGSLDFRRSWIQWTNAHSHFGQSCRGKVRGAGMTGLVVWTPTTPAESATWCKCEHGTDNFLTWHRMFLWYFERVLQQAANDPLLRLPYWDYGKDPVLPAAFRARTYVNETGQTVPNPLFVAERQPALNAGTAGLAASVRNATGAMTATTYSTFRVRLENAPHGAVHCAVAAGGCPNGRMGAVASAAIDPVFWVHHANIDRLYDCWARVNEVARLPTSAALLNRSYSFIDSNGTTQVRRVRDMRTTAQLGYAYSTGAGCPASPLSTKDVAVADAGGTVLNRGVTTAPVAMDSGAVSALAPKSGRARKSATLILEGLEVDEVPGVLYEVYIEAPGAVRQSVGIIDFFGFGSDEQGGHSGHGGNGGKRFEFDVTDALSRLWSKPGAKISVVLEPTTGLTDSSPTVAAEAISTKAKVRFDRARIVADP